MLAFSGFNANAYDYKGQEDRVTNARARPTSSRTPLTAIEALRALDPARHVKSGSLFFKGAKYVGWKSCNSCHAEQVKEWKNTWHAKMEQRLTKKTVIGEFNGVPVTYKNIKVKSKDGKVKAVVTFQVIPFEKDGSYWFTVVDQDNEANNQTFKMEKTLGGKWDQGYEILIGTNYYPSLLRYSNTGGGWLVKSFKPALWIEPDGTPDGRPRSAEELPKHRVAEAKCAGCHTSGFDYKKDEKGVWQAVGDGQLGVGCEKCHGPASLHIKAAEAAAAADETLAPDKLKIVHGLKDLDYQQQTQLCAQCHGRATNRNHKEIAFPLQFLPGDMNITEKLVFWSYQGNPDRNQTKYFYRNDWAKRNRQQWQDHQRSTHYNKAKHSCLTCHTVHGKWKNMQLRQEPQKLCTSCHTAEQHAARPQTEMFADSKMELAGVTCINCHMARIGFRSHLTTKSVNAKDYPMDGSSHNYLVPTPEIKKAWGVRTACEVCHTKGRNMPPQIFSWITQNPMNDDELDARIKRIQSRTRAQVDEVRVKLRAFLPRTAVGKAKVESARANLNFVLLDGSMGFHNRDKAKQKLDEALALLDRAAGMQFGWLRPSSPAGKTGSVETASSGAPAAPSQGVKAAKPSSTKLLPAKPIERLPSEVAAKPAAGPTPTSKDKPKSTAIAASTAPLAAIIKKLTTGSIKPAVTPEGKPAADKAGADVATDTNVVNDTEATPQPMLRLGYYSDQVRALQCLLKAKGYDVIVDSNYGPGTKSAVRQFQSDEGLGVDGIAGEETVQTLQGLASQPELRTCYRARIVKKAQLTTTPDIVMSTATSDFTPRLLKFGDMGDDVRLLQTVLNAKGYGIDVDARYGPMTRRAVKLFQAKFGLAVDGVAGEMTVTRLLGV